MENRLDNRCSMWSRSVSLDPIGSAGCYNGYLLLPLPLPWPNDISDIAGIGPLLTQAKQLGVRVQAIASPDHSGMVILYQRSDTNSFAGYKQTQVIPDKGNSLIDAAQALLDDVAEQEEPQQGHTVRDLLVCTHGRRDRCCGSLGTMLFTKLQALTTTPGWSSVRLWRTSHTGGHRFAPTVLVLPEGTLWAFMDATSVEAVLHREGDSRSVAPVYRGCAGLSSPQAQVLERTALNDSGWKVLEAVRSSNVDVDGSHVLECTWADGTTTQWRSRVESRQVGPIPTCGGEPADQDNWTVEWSTVGDPL